MMKSFRISMLLMLVALLFMPAGAASMPSAGTLPAEIVARDPVNWDKTLVVSAPETVKRFRQKQGLVLVDVRAAADRSLAGIPGAMHIPLAFLKTKTFLKGRPVVLVGSGHDSVDLLAAGRDLNAQGFKMRVLAGGIQAWLAAQGPLTGNPAALIPKREMRPEAFYREKNIADRPVLLVTAGQDRTEEDAILPFAIRISLETKPADIKKKIGTASVDLPPLICTPDGRGHDRIAAKFAQAGCGPVLFLEGGLAAYRAYLAGMLQARRPRTDRLKTVGGCQGCGPMDGVETTSNDQN